MVLIPRVRYDRLLDTSADSERGVSEHPEKAVNDKELKESRKLDDVAAPVAAAAGAAVSPKERVVSNLNKGAEKQSDAKMPMDNILDEMSSDYRDSAEEMLTKMNDKGGVEMNWNARGRLIYKGKVVNGSSMSELLEQLFSKRKGKVPAGFNLFLKGVERMNINGITKSKNRKVKVEKKKSVLQKSWITY